MEEIRRVAQAWIATPAQVALSWVHCERWHTVSPAYPSQGTHKRNRLEENLGAPDIQLTEAELEVLDRLAQLVQGIRPV
ncbi:hypothetical protein [Xanthomonas sacchari]|uniref:hypothetical protein n=1 Tax=Xanthomonas sacchari TaxID=56458 RepID=UPI003D18ED8A